MATHLQRVAGVFQERVLPYFPLAKKRFDRHFKGSYELLRETPNDSSMDFNLCVLGLKPLSKDLSYDELKKHSTSISEAGLEFVPVLGGRIFSSPESRAKLLSEEIGIPFTDALKAVREELSTRGCGAWMYDPVLASEILSSKLRVPISPQEVKQYLESGAGFFRLMGYPQPLPKTAIPESFLKVVSFSIAHQRAPTVCSVSEVNSLLASLEARASAAAIVEETRQTPTWVRSASIIYSHGNIVNNVEHGVIIKRAAEVGVWSVATVSNLPEPLLNLPQFFL